MKDPKTEAFLDRFQYAWEYHEVVNFTEIDITASEENPARANRRLDEVRAMGYGAEMLDGVQFPAIVLLNLAEPYDSFLYIIATGVHRTLGALDADFKAIDAYVVTEPDNFRREELLRLLNRIEGRGMTTQEILNQVLWLKEQFPSKTLTELAKDAEIKLNLVTAAYNEEKARIRARSFGVDLERLKLPQKATTSLGSIHSDRVFEAAIHFVQDVGKDGVTGAEVQEMVREIKKARDEKAALEIVRRAREVAEKKLERARAKRGRLKPAPANRLMADARRLNNHFDKPLDELHIAALEQRPEAIEVVRDLIENLKRLVTKIEDIEKMSRPPVRRPGASAPALHP